MTDLRRPESLYPAAIGGFFVLVLVALALAPIVPYDADLFFHLRHGRTIAQQHALPGDTGSFSFLAPPRPFVDYSWLFQLLLHATARAASGYGLIAWRTLAALLLLLVVARFLRPKEGAGARDLLASLFVFALLLRFFLPRLELVRPHTTSYLLLVLVLGLLERRGRDRSLPWLLPALALVWVNLHGIEYPLLVLLLAAYAADWASERARGAASGLRRPLALLLAFAAIFATPAGARLLPLPFTDFGMATASIGELAPVGPARLLELVIDRRSGLDRASAFTLLFWLSLIALVAAAARRRLRPAHGLLWLGGLFLMSRSGRMTYEYSLLCLPLLRTLRWPAGTLPRWFPRTAAAAAAICAALLVVAWPVARSWRQAPASYPLATARWPVATASFLRAVDPGHATVLHHPDVGGYLMYALPDQFRIFADLEAPFPFADADIYRAASTFVDPVALRSFLEQYRPTFVLAPASARNFPRLIRDTGYELVFFEAAGALYVDAAALPALADAHQLALLDAFTLGSEDWPRLDPAERAARRGELERVLASADGNDLVQATVATLDHIEGNDHAALAHTDAILARGEPSPAVRALRGAVLLRLGRNDQAARTLRRGLAAAGDDDPERRRILRTLATAEALRGNARRALSALEQAVGRFEPAAPVVDLIALAELAAAAGLPSRAASYYTFALDKIPPGEAALRQDVADRRSRLAGH